MESEERQNLARVIKEKDIVLQKNDAWGGINCYDFEELVTVLNSCSFVLYQYEPNQEHQENIKMLSHTYLYLVALFLKIRKISKLSNIFCLFCIKILYDKAQIKKTVV